VPAVGGIVGTTFAFVIALVDELSKAWYQRLQHRAPPAALAETMRL
jgi:hypothetical protein